LLAWLGWPHGGNAMPHRGRRRRKAALEAEVEDIRETDTFNGTSISQCEYKMQDIEMNKMIIAGAEDVIIADAKEVKEFIADAKDAKCEAHAEPHADAHEPYTEENKIIGKEVDDDEECEDEGSSSQLSPRQALLQTKVECEIAARYLLDAEVLEKMDDADHAVLAATVLKVRDRLAQQPRPSFEEAGKMMSLMEYTRDLLEKIHAE